MALYIKTFNTSSVPTFECKFDKFWRKKSTLDAVQGEWKKTTVLVNPPEYTNDPLGMGIVKLVDLVSAAKYVSQCVKCENHVLCFPYSS